MDVKVTTTSIQAVTADAILAGYFEGESTPSGDTGGLDKALRGVIRELIQANDLRGKLNEVSVLYTRGAAAAPRVILLGLGKADQLSADRIRQTAATGAKKARELGCKSIALTVPGTGDGKLDVSQAAQALTEGALLGLYRWRTNHTTPVEHLDPHTILVVASDSAKIEAIEAGVKTGQVVASGVCRARDLVNQSPNNLTPVGLAEAAKKVASESGLKCTIHDLKWIKAQKMNAFLAVAQASVNPPTFIELEYKGSKDAPVVFIGKGITFDSGGISIKPVDGMEDMRTDMGGAAAVIGALEAIAKLKLPIHIVGLIAACENLPGGSAYRPADVIRSRSGKTIEIITTDAEGRMTLADALDYAAEFKPQAVIDLATLTGACVIALGENVAAGHFTNDETLAQKVENASRMSDEKLWRLPLYPEYRDKIKTDYADLKNSGGRMGGVGTSAMFLQEFTSYPWSHWDIAGMVLDKIGPTSYYPLTHLPYVIRGATGFGVRALVSLAGNWNPK